MSFSRENVIWRSRTGDWYIGFFEAHVWGDDPEWDVDYNFDAFQWASGPHRSADEAINSWHGANPGAHTHYDQPGADTDRFDKMFREYQFREYQSSPLYYL